MSEERTYQRNQTSSREAPERITGAFDSFITGQPALKSPGEILSRCRDAKLVEEAASTITPGGTCRIKVIPAAPQSRPLETALMDGLFLARWDVEGKTPDRIRLQEGSYFYFVQRINNRWVGFAVDGRGRLACSTLGIIAKQHIAIHPDEPHPMVRIHPHPLASPEEVSLLFGGAGLGLAAEQDWVDYSTWEQHGTGCITTTFCSPTT